MAPTIETYLKRNLFAEAEEAARVKKSAVTDTELAELAKAALPDGTFPIQTAADLDLAIEAVKGLKNGLVVKAHIRKRAKNLDMSGKLPKAFNDKAEAKRVKALTKMAADLGTIVGLCKVDDATTVEFSSAITKMASTDFSGDVIGKMSGAIKALRKSIESIAGDDAVVDKGAAVRASFTEFLDHLSGFAPGNIVKSLRKGAIPMSKFTKQLAKAYGPSSATTTAKAGKNGKEPPKVVTEEGTKDPAEGTPAARTGSKKNLLKVAKVALKKAKKSKRRLDEALNMDKKAKTYFNDDDNDMDDEKKKKFLDMPAEERLKFMEANPIADMAKRALDNLPAEVKKQLEQSKANSEAIAKREEAADKVEFAKRAADVGQPAEFGEHLRTLAKGLGTAEERTKAFEAIDTVMKAQANQIKAAGLFKSLGSDQQQGGDAMAQLLAKADEKATEVNKAKGAGEKRMTKEQAFSAVYEDPANAELVQRYKQENGPARIAA